MHIYSDADLYSKLVQDEASEAYLNKKISEESYKMILTTYPSNLYTPNYFIRIALGVLTMVAIIFSALLILLMFLSKAETRGTGQCFTLAAIYYAGLELLVRSKKYYNAGIDNLLIFFSAGFLIAGIEVFQPFGNHLMASSIAMLACLYLSIRFVDGFMAVLSFLALFVFVFFAYTGLGTFAKATVPFLLVIVSGVIYLVMKKLIKNEKYLLYQHPIKCALQISLLAFYVAANYFVITKVTYKMFPYQFSANYPIPFDWLFWVLTFVIPIAYVAFGMAKKDLMFIRTGLLLVAASIFTFRYYFHVVPADMAMLTFGALLTAGSYILINYLKSSRRGFSFNKPLVADKERINMKSLILAQVSGKNKPLAASVEFGSGSFGSGGAGSNY